MSDKVEILTFASLLWQLFNAVIYGVLNSFEKLIGKTALEKNKSKISVTIEDMLGKSLQLDADYIKSEIKAKKLGALI